MLFNELVAGQKILASGGQGHRPIRGIAYDSRRVEPGFLFVAVKGLKTDGHRYVEQALARGAVALVLEEPLDVPPGVCWVRVPDTRIALGLLATEFYAHPSQKLRMIGVTGTNGKTTTTNLIRAIYKEAGRQTGLIGTIANYIGERALPVEHTTPESLDLQKLLADMVEAGVDAALMEVSSHALALQRVAGCEFDVAVFTNITQDHLDFHQDMDNYLAAKARLFEQLGDGSKPGSKFAVINADDPRAGEIIARTRVPVITYSVVNPSDVKAGDINVTARGVSFAVESTWGNCRLNLKLTGLFNVYNALAAFTVGAVEGLPVELVSRALAGVSGVHGRFELVDRGQDFAVVVDYAHTPDGLENILKTARQITTGRLITVFGCGGDRDRTKRPIMGEIAARYSDRPVVTSDNPRTEEPLAIIKDVEEGVSRVLAPESYEVIPDRREAIKYAIQNARSGDVVIIAGKGHEDYQIIGTQKFHFDDREEAAKALEALGSN